jgi:hypothetical protein
MGKIEYEYPDGYKCEKVEKKFYGDVYELVHIFKKEKVKDFDWYINEYFKRGCILDGFKLPTEWAEGWLRNHLYHLVSFEIKIGLIKFICEKIDVHFQSFMHELIHLKQDGTEMTIENKEIQKICPSGFLNSIFND